MCPMFHQLEFPLRPVTSHREELNKFLLNQAQDNLLNTMDRCPNSKDSSQINLMASFLNSNIQDNFLNTRGNSLSINSFRGNFKDNSFQTNNTQDSFSSFKGNILNMDISPNRVNSIRALVNSYSKPRMDLEPNSSLSQDSCLNNSLGNSRQGLVRWIRMVNNNNS